MSDGLIAYDFAGIDNLSRELQGHFTKLGALADSLKGEVNRLQNNWQSAEGAAAYAAAQSKWDSTFAEARSRLHGLGNGVENAGLSMRQADQRVRNSFL